MSAGLRNQTAEVQSLLCRLSNYVIFALKISVPHQLKLELWMNPDGHYMVMVSHLPFISSTIRMVGELTFAIKFSRYCFYILSLNLNEIDSFILRRNKGYKCSTMRPSTRA